MKLKICAGNYDCLGVNKTEDAVTFSIQTIGGMKCSLKLYQRNSIDKEIEIPMDKAPNGTGIFSIGIKEFDENAYDYNFVIDEKLTVDPYARRIIGRERWADDFKNDEEKIKCRIYNSDFQWDNDVLPHIKKQEMVMYKLHVRGFTKAVKKKQYSGYFDGVKRKIPYLKELGITTLLFMPLNEFDEWMDEEGKASPDLNNKKLNYWGYKKGNYFAVKSSYIGNNHHPDEWKKLIQKLHKNNIECIMELFFDNKTNPHLIIDCLRFWAKEYHVDGFRLICDSLAAQLAAQDFYLSGRKLFYERFDQELLFGERQLGPEIFTYNDEFSYSCRKMLNYHGGSLHEFTGQMRRQDYNQGFVNYITDNNGFTLYDLFSYTKKRNEGNLEDNQDGNDFNFSGNCGEEGVSKRKSVLTLRMRQVKNALLLTILSQGVPMLWMGDESLNSQMGNNNAYCQDNEIGWMNWDNKIKSKQILKYTAQLIQFRKEHPILCDKAPMKLYDSTGIGFPDLSYHSNIAWMTDFKMNQPYVGLMYCNNEEHDGKMEFIYLALNFQLISQEFAIPTLPRGFEWRLFIDTRQEESMLHDEGTAMEQKQTFFVHSQTMVVLVSKENKIKRKIKRKINSNKTSLRKGGKE